MSGEVANAVARVQDIVDAITSVTFKSFPDFPVEHADAFPMSIAYMSGGKFIATNYTTTHLFPVIRAEFHFSRVNLKKAYQDIYNVAVEFSTRLAGDPTLNGTVNTIVSTDDQPLEWVCRPFEWGAVKSEAMIFEIPIKLLETPIQP